ncbi:hypothetical protein DVH24_018586 [Malus domestica]|uniref:Uncharacterized protein n=1 Tax=Malus domestica TaxID=3750 RepID=A0A498HPX6_MALDO|nr:hypothetical protein DVH24_018586 [Malus domestica]
MSKECGTGKDERTEKYDLLEVPIQRDDGWNYVAGSTQEEMEEYEIRKAGSKTCGGGGWPETAASQP